MGFLDLFKRRKKTKIITEIVEQEGKKIQAGIAFGGGGARGFGHIGAIKAFEEYGIDFTFVAGTSAGSMVGAMYAHGFTSEQMTEMAKSIKEKDIRNSKVIFVPSRSSNLEDVMRGFIGDVVFSDLKKPFIAVAADIKSGEEVWLKSGSVARAVSASCAVPAIFTPVLWQDYILQDGGLCNTVPGDVVKKMGADVSVSIDINCTRGSGTGTDSFKTLDILSASLGIAMKSAAFRGRLGSDLIIEPDLKRFRSTKIGGIDEMIEEGYRATVEKIPEIKKLLHMEG